MDLNTLVSLRQASIESLQAAAVAEPDEIDDGDLEDLDQSEDGDEEDGGDPGNACPCGGDNHGDDVEPRRKVGRDLKKSITSMAAENRRLKRAIRRLELQHVGVNVAASREERMESMTAAAGREHIHRLAPHVIGLLRGAGIDAGSLLASGKKLSVGQVDQILASRGKLDPQIKILCKNELASVGLMRRF